MIQFKIGDRVRIKGILNEWDRTCTIVDIYSWNFETVIKVRCPYKGRFCYLSCYPYDLVPISSIAFNPEWKDLWDMN